MSYFDSEPLQLVSLIIILVCLVTILVCDNLLNKQRAKTLKHIDEMLDESGDDELKNEA